MMDSDFTPMIPDFFVDLPLPFGGARGQVLPAGLAEFEQEVHVAVPHEVRNSCRVRLGAR